MTQHEYVFVAISIILGLAITRLLHTMGMLIRAHRGVSFHWSTALWAVCVLSYALQFWWVGWGQREISDWSFPDFAVLTAGAICVYGAAEMALSVPEGGGALLMLLIIAAPRTFKAAAVVFAAYTAAILSVTA